MSDTESQMRTQLIKQLGVVAESMRQCAAIADDYAQVVSGAPRLPPAGRSKRKAVEVEEVDGKKKRKKREPRDPDEPKRPASSYILFQNEVRAALKKEFPHMTHQELVAEMTKRWNVMEETDKAKYLEANTTAKEKYQVEKAAYQAAKSAKASVPEPEDSSTPPAPAPKKAAAKPAAKAQKVVPKSAEIVPSSDDDSGDVASTEEEVEVAAEEDSDSEPEPEPPVKKAKTAGAVTPRTKRQVR